jgi:hypothetical protein
MFKVSTASLQTFIDMPKCVLEDGVQYSTVHTLNVSCDGHLQIINCVGSVRQVHRDFLITLYNWSTNSFVYLSIYNRLLRNRYVNYCVQHCKLLVPILSLTNTFHTHIPYYLSWKKGTSNVVSRSQ